LTSQKESVSVLAAASYTSRKLIDNTKPRVYLETSGKKSKINGSIGMMPTDVVWGFPGTDKPKINELRLDGGDGAPADRPNTDGSLQKSQIYSQAEAARLQMNGA
jgi:hypothetical protein